MCSDYHRRFFMKRNGKSFLAVAILFAAGLWLVGPERQLRARAVGGSTVEARGEPKTPGALTFNKDIAQIIFNNCASCHRPGAAAPFSLLSYQDVKKRAKQIEYITEKRIMPPWKADQGDYEFKDERRLTGEQIGMIRRWIEDGAPEGDPKDAPSPPATNDGWRRGTPDLIVKMSEAFSVPADGPDIYRNFALPLNLSEDKWVRGIEFKPGARTVVHHSLFFFDATGASRKLDEEDPLPGYNGGMGGIARSFFGSGNLRRPINNQSVDQPVLIGGLGGWAVGAQGRALPEGLSWTVPKGSDLVISTHFHPSGKPEKEISTVGIYFTD